MAPARLRFYILMEIGLLTVWPMGLVAGLALVQRRVRTRAVALTMAIVWVWLCVPVVFAAVYSPAFLSPDEFYQRIVVEGLAYGCFGALLFTAPATFLAAIIWGVSFFLKLLLERPKP